MANVLLYPAGTTAACGWAAEFLAQAGTAIIDHPSPEVTHLLLDVPSFGPDGALRGGGDLKTILSMLPETVTVVGGNLSHPLLAGKATFDLLREEAYLAENAAITADCALRLAGEKLPIPFRGCPVLILGWGRIGKCLGKILASLGANVTIAARKDSDRAMLQALGYAAVDLDRSKALLPSFRLIVNTAPAPLLSERDLASCGNCVKLDLASRLGITGEDVLWARGLPGKMEAEASGNLIAQTLLRRFGRE